MKTDHFILFYQEGQEKQAWELLRIMEFQRPAVEKLTGNRMDSLPLVIENAGSYVNGYTDPVFRNIHLFSHQPFGTSDIFIENWWAVAGVHEYTHMLHLTLASGIPLFLSRAFGNIFAPNIFSPLWLDEGITVYSESRISPFQGRLNDGFFDAYMACCTREDQFPGIVPTTYPSQSFPGNTGPYLFGGEFFHYLAFRYGPERFSRFFRQNGSSVFSYCSPVLPFLGIDRSAKKVFGKPFPALWAEWKEYEKKRWMNEEQEGVPMTRYGWDMEDLKIHEHRLYFKRQYPVKTDSLSYFYFQEIIEKDIATGREKVMVSTTSFFSVSMKFHDKALYYGVADVKRGYANTAYDTFGYYTILYKKDLRTGRSQEVLRDQIRAFDVLARTNILYVKDKEDEFGCTIFQYDPREKRGKKLFDTDYLVNEILVQKGRIIVCARKQDENFNLYLLDLDDHEFKPLFHTPFLQIPSAFYQDRLFFHSNDNGVYSIYSWDFTQKKALKYTKKGFCISPALDEDTRTLYFIGLNSSGFDLYSEKAEPEEVKGLEEGSTRIPVLLPVLDEEKIRHGGYADDLKSLLPAIWLPFVNMVQGQKEAGFAIMGNDILAHFQYFSTFLYDFKQEHLNWDLNLATGFFSPLRIWLDMKTLFDQEHVGIPGFEGTFEYPLYKSQVPGLSLFSTGISLDFQDDFDQLVTDPYLKFQMNWPYLEQRFILSLFLEDKKILSRRNGKGVRLDSMSRFYIYKSQGLVKFILLSDPESLSSMPVIRGYAGLNQGREALTATLEYSLPFLFIRNGLWNPNIFLEDVVATLFFDSAGSRHHGPQFSSGVELKMETRIAFEVPLVWGVRFSMNKEKEKMIEFFLTSYLSL